MMSDFGANSAQPQSVKPEDQSGFPVKDGSEGVSVSPKSAVVLPPGPLFQAFSGVKEDDHHDSFGGIGGWDLARGKRM